VEMRENESRTKVSTCTGESSKNQEKDPGVSKSDTWERINRQQTKKSPRKPVEVFKTCILKAKKGKKGTRTCLGWGL